jgi:hypothetical protein
MEAPQPELTIDWRHDGYRVIRIFVQDPLDQATRERLMSVVVTFRDIPDVASLRNAAKAIAQETGLIWTFSDEPDHTDPFGEWVTIGYRRP